MKRLNLIIFVLLTVVVLHTTYAQGPPPPPDGGGGDGVVIDVAINFLIYPFMILGSYLGYRFIKKSSKS